MSLTLQEEELLQNLGFALEIGRLVKEATGGALERFAADDGEDLGHEAGALTVRMPSDQIPAFMESRQRELLEAGYRAFWSMRRQANGMSGGDELVVLKTTDSFEIIRLRRTDGANYDITTEDILARLEQWGALCEFHVNGAASDWCSLEFETLPKDLCDFAEDVYRFCPDTVSQGVGLSYTEEDLAVARRLCPRTSASLAELEAKERADVDALLPQMDELTKQFFELARASDLSTSDGVKLLAYYLITNKALFLWWD